jgi:hypothetical protein
MSCDGKNGPVQSKKYCERVTSAGVEGPSGVGRGDDDARVNYRCWRCLAPWAVFLASPPSSTAMSSSSSTHNGHLGIAYDSDDDMQVDSGDESAKHQLDVDADGSVDEDGLSPPHSMAQQPFALNGGTTSRVYSVSRQIYHSSYMRSERVLCRTTTTRCVFLSMLIDARAYRMHQGYDDPAEDDDDDGTYADEEYSSAKKRAVKKKKKRPTPTAPSVRPKGEPNVVGSRPMPNL